MKIRIDINKLSDGDKPELIGVWIEGFGWVLGGAKDGDITLDATIVVDERQSTFAVHKFMKRVRNREFQTNHWGIKR